MCRLPEIPFGLPAVIKASTAAMLLSLFAGCQRDEPVRPIPGCEGEVQWPIPGSDSLYLAYSHDASGLCCIGEFTDPSEEGDVLCLSAQWQALSGDPDSWMPSAVIGAGDSIGFLRPPGSNACHDEWLPGDTVPVFGELMDSALLLYPFILSCSFEEGDSYVAFVQLVNGQKYAGYIKLRKWLGDGYNWRVLHVRKSLCSGQDLVIAD